MSTQTYLYPKGISNICDAYDIVLYDVLEKYFKVSLRFVNMDAAMVVSDPFQW